MCDGSKQDKHVPNGVIMGLCIVGKEVSSCSIGDAFSKKKPKRRWIQSLQDWLCNEDDAPSHHQIDCERESRPAVYRKDFIEDSAYDNYPLKRKDCPAEPSAYYSDEDWRVAAGYHHVDADVVALAQSTLHLSLSHPMINGATEEHKEHAEQEANDSERHLPANIGCEPHKPDAAQSKDGSTKVRPSVADFAFNGPKALRLHPVSFVSSPRKSARMRV